MKTLRIRAKELRRTRKRALENYKLRMHEEAAAAAATAKKKK
ncbi:MAG: hypothetical protein NT018_13175 [Armatimonadetes bacterium]|nr:hypothetical protein [Armatimonadota bacterium]